MQLYANLFPSAVPYFIKFLSNELRVQAYLILLLEYFLRRTSLSMTIAFLWVITQRVVRGGWSNYHYSLSNNPEERSSHPLRGGSLKSRCFSIIMQKHVSVSYIQSALSTAVLCYSEVQHCLRQCFSNSVRPRPGKFFFFIRRGPGPNKFTRKYLSNFF